MGKKVARSGGWELSDEVLSWSVQEVLDPQLYKEQVHKIPSEFDSIDNYLQSYVMPLIEETRSDLCSSLELIIEAPCSKILSMEEMGRSGSSYGMDVDFSVNGADCSSEPYTARNGDIFILSNLKPESAEDFDRYGMVYCLAMVTDVSVDEGYQKGFRVKVWKDLSAEDNLNKFTYAVFLTNILSNVRIWKALHFDTGINNNFTIIKKILNPKNMADDICGICIDQRGDCLASFRERLPAINLNQSQVDAVESVISALRCKHSNLIKLIWGPPGTGKTKTTSTMLWVLRHLKCRTLTCAPTNVAVAGVCSRLLQVLREFNELGDMNGLPCSLGDVLLFGNRVKMDITDELRDVFLDHRVDELFACFSSLSGWRHRISSMIALLEDCGSQYDMLLQDAESGDPLCFLDFLKKQFDVVSEALKNCMKNLLVHLPEWHFSDSSASRIFELFELLEKFDGLLSDISLTDDNVKRAFGLLSGEDSICAKDSNSVEKELDEKFHGLLSDISLTDDNVKRAFGLLSGEDSICAKDSNSVEKELDEKFDGLLSDISLTDDNVKRAFDLLSGEDSICAKDSNSVEKELDETRTRCLKTLKALQKSLHLPHDVDRNWTEKYCVQNSTLVFCTASSSYRLHHMEVAPFDVLIVDEAAQLREAELVIPLRLHWVKHVVLVGDDRQLRSMVRSQVCKEAGFGLSLFERLVSLGFEKHLLNVQYRMDPSISLFPNAHFYPRKILDGQNVKSPSYNREYTRLLFGSYTFVNIADGREEMDGIGASRRNMVEVAVALHLVQTVFRYWEITCQKVSIGIVSPYSSQVNEIKRKLGTKYDTFDGFDVRVKSVDGFQGQEDDIIILSTVRANSKGVVGFLADIERTNVALTRARHCLWILGNACTLSRSGTIWADLVVDAQNRKCLFNATDDAVLSKLVLRVKHGLDELDDLLKSDSALFSNTRWKVIFSDEFRKSFTKLKSSQLRKEIIQMLGRLGTGWRTRLKNHDNSDTFQLARLYKVKDLYLVWSTDVEKNERFSQIIRIWDILPLQNVEGTIKRLENLFSMYTDDYLNHCRTVHIEGKLEVPMVWEFGHDVVRYKKDSRVGAPVEDHAHVDLSYAMENSKVSDSFLLMKFYSLSSGVAKHLLTASDGSEIDIPFELTDEEEEILRFQLSSFILGRSGTGKTTILTMKLIQKEQLSLVASQGRNSEVDGCNSITLEDVEPTQERYIKQIFITVSSKLCSAIKNQICRLKRFAAGDLSDQPNLLDMHEINDELDEFVDIPDSFSDLPRRHYPLVITFRKFLMMLDGTLWNSFFDKFYGDWGVSSERGHPKSRALLTFIESKEVDYQKFASYYWPHFNAELTKKLDASTVYTQIMSHIKCGYRNSTDGKLQRQDYIMLSDKRFSSLSVEMRERIYDVFLYYENRKSTSREFDLSDFVNSLHYTIGSEGYNGDLVDVVYIDEVQDLTMSQIALLKYVCRNYKEGFLFAGDTAQTIARGIDFRFEDIRSLFYTEFLSELEGSNQVKKHGKEIRVSNMFQLSQNFRTHCGVLSLAQSVMSLLYYFFPSCVDKLSPENSLVYGEAPVLLESGNDENAIITIFGESKKKHGNINGFGAEQAILVRDAAAKKQITDLVGKQALVLTIIECKGLEFQDVLLYNFFSSSPLQNKWRVMYEYMKNKDILASFEEISHPDFDKTKHHLLCSELKQLYVAITRTKQRLWICENTDDYCQPMFDYWKKLCLVQVRVLDSSLVQAMQTASSAEEWRLRGIKLFNEGQFELATMCFEKAGDAYREKWARAAGLLASAEHIIATNLEMGEASLIKAAEIYESIGKHEKAATCYIKLRDFMKAGMIYLEKCGTSKLEAAADCFSMVECWSLAADAYFKAKCYTKCFSMCSKSKGKLFDLGLQFLQQLEESVLEETSSSELVAIRSKYLEDCAVHYFNQGDIKHMMSFVRAFSSVDHVREFLKSKNLLDDLLNVEIERGNFSEAAEIAKVKGDLLLEVDMLQKAGSFENAARLILLHVIMNSLWAFSNRGWPPKNFAQKEHFLNKAKELAKKVSDSFYNSTCLGADILSYTSQSVASLSGHLVELGKCGNMLFELLAARAILDVHLRSEPSGYVSELEPCLDVEKSSHDMLAHNQLSAETLMFSWNQWKSIIVRVLSWLRHPKDCETNDSVAIYEDVCAEYFALRKDGDRDSYIVLNTDSSWLSNAGRAFLRQEGNSCWLSDLQFHSCAQNYWSNELYSVGVSVLEKLEYLVTFSRKQVLSPYEQGRTVLDIYEVAKFLKEFEFIIPRNITKLGRFFDLSKDCFLNIVFPLDWKDGAADGVLYLHETPAGRDLLDYTLHGNFKPSIRKLTHGQLGRIAMLLLLSGRLDDTLISKVIPTTDQMEWAEFFQALKSFLDYGAERAPLVFKFRGALEVTFAAKWMYEVDYMSPICFVHLLESLTFLASSCRILNSCMFCTKSSLTQMLKCRGLMGYLDSCLASRPDSEMEGAALKSLDFIVHSIRVLLSDKHSIQQWVHRTSISTDSYVPILLKLVITLYLVTLSARLGDPYEVANFLSSHDILHDLPEEFSRRIRHAMCLKYRTWDTFTRIFADALAAIGNRLVLMGSPNGLQTFQGFNAYVINSDELRDVEKVRRLLFPPEPKQQEATPPKAQGKRDVSKIRDDSSQNIPSASGKDEQQSTSKARSDETSKAFWEKFEAFRVDKQGQGNASSTIGFLGSLLSWLEQREPVKGLDVQLVAEVRDVCDRFKRLSLREAAKSAVPTISDLYSMWQDGENKLQMLICSLAAERDSNGAGTESATASLEMPASQPDAGTDTAEAAGDVCSTSKSSSASVEVPASQPDAGADTAKATADACRTSKGKGNKQKNKKGGNPKRKGKK